MLQRLRRKQEIERSQSDFPHLAFHVEQQKLVSAS
jgi:hypothetical protein